MSIVTSHTSCGWPITQEVSHFLAAVGGMVAVVSLMVVASMAVGVEGRAAGG